MDIASRHFTKTIAVYALRAAGINAYVSNRRRLEQALRKTCLREESLDGNEHPLPGPRTQHDRFLRRLLSDDALVSYAYIVRGNSSASTEVVQM